MAAPRLTVRHHDPNFQRLTQKPDFLCGKKPYAWYFYSGSDNGLESSSAIGRQLYWPPHHEPNVSTSACQSIKSV